MSSTQTSPGATAEAARPTATSMRLEVIVVPVADVDRAKAFYEGLGWRVDGDFKNDGERVVQVTPPASNTSIIFGQGVTTAEPGSIDRVLLAVDDIDVALDELRAHGAEVGEVFHDADGGLGGGWRSPEGRETGRDPDGRSYASYAEFSDPDGNVWLLQEITERLPGRIQVTDVSALSALLRETAEGHGSFESATPPHEWSDWYAAYMEARQAGSSADESVAAADDYMASAKGIVRS